MSRQPAPDTKTAKRSHGASAAFLKDGTPYFRASLTYRGKHISLGSFPTREKACAAYLEGKHILSDLSCLPETYAKESALPFEKWVCLSNYRDNGLYIGNPIYIADKMFCYYLSPSRVLKFDPEDLFYYSSHKIMYRGNHYFVADYGLQVSIVSRYGIKPYARQGRDYRFINGDSGDFRRENLEIFNVYHGVSSTTKNGQHIYTVRIHIRGNYIVGRYGDEITAAIAYNKAVDVLLKNGVSRKFLPNYIEDLPPSKYAEIYSSLQISRKILDYRP